MLNNCPHANRHIFFEKVSKSFKQISYFAEDIAVILF